MHPAREPFRTFTGKPMIPLVRATPSKLPEPYRLVQTHCVVSYGDETWAECVTTWTLAAIATARAEGCEAIVAIGPQTEWAYEVFKGLAEGAELEYEWIDWSPILDSLMKTLMPGFDITEMVADIRQAKRWAQASTQLCVETEDARTLTISIPKK